MSSSRCLPKVHIQASERDTRFRSVGAEMDHVLFLGVVRPTLFPDIGQKKGNSLSSHRKTLCGNYI